VVAPESVGLDAAQMQRARDLLHEQVDSGRSPGLVSIVARRGEIVLAEAIGARNPDGDPMDFDTAFSIASATKPLTAAVIMSLVEEGKVGLMQRVADYLPELPDALRDRLLVHHLLTHTGGFEAVTWTGRAKERRLHHADEDARWGRDPVVNAYLGCIPDLEIKKPPGAGMLYANLGYEMLGEIVRRITGDSLGAAMRSRIFEPLHMDDSAMVPGPELRSRMVRPEPGMPLTDQWAQQMMGIDVDTALASDFAAGGVVSTPADYVRFGLMILGGGTLDGERVLSRASVRSMTTNQIPGVPDLMFGNKEACWGYGFSVLGHERWPYFGGGIVPLGTARHAGAGGIDHWFDFENQIAATCFELVTEISPMLEPISAVGYRFQDVITAAVVD
jgi:CubicO group peptidase (beta-lactamase class C family)